VKETIMEAKNAIITGTATNEKGWPCIKSGELEVCIEKDEFFKNGWDKLKTGDVVSILLTVDDKAKKYKYNMEIKKET